jgi:hypothetical protein
MVESCGPDASGSGQRLMTEMNLRVPHKAGHLLTSRVTISF